MTIIERIKENACKHPDRIAVVESSVDGINCMTWNEVDTYSDRLAYYLDINLSSTKPVIVYGHKDPLMIVFFLACVKSGRAYCPVDINVPLSRVEMIIDEVDPDIVLCTEDICLNRDRVMLKNEIKEIVENDDCTLISKEHFLNKEDVFYIIFTSGSTGTPKGVQITRDCLDNFVRWAVSLGSGCQKDEYYTFINQAPFSFDLSVMDIYMSLYTGGTLWCLTKDLQSDMKMLYESLRTSGGNKWVSTPSFVEVCLSDPAFTQSLLKGLTDFLFCGEILTNKTAERLRDRFPNANIVNTYGPTESTCAVTSLSITDEIINTWTPLPVGVAKPGTWIEIWDEEGNEIKEKDQGEIVIIGDSVSVGYWQNDELNKRSFGMKKIGAENYRYYRTGDAGYKIEDMLFYAGRIDLQVKLHGYRIELEDIENNLLEIEGITQAVVAPKYRDGKVSSLVAVVVSNNKIDNEKESARKIKDKLKTRLPEYMIPKKIRFMTGIPITNNGKADRKALDKLI